MNLITAPQLCDLLSQKLLFVSHYLKPGESTAPPPPCIFYNIPLLGEMNRNLDKKKRIK